MKKQWIRLLVCIAAVLALCALTPVALAAEAPFQSANAGDQNYTVWGTTVNSHLVDNGDGTFTRVEYTGSEVIVELYDSDYKFISGRTIETELPVYGGYFSGSDGNYLIFGQNNPAEDDSVEVIRVVKYSRDWERLGSASLHGANTTVPFRAGSLRCAEYNGYLYVRTCHEMYTSPNDGLNHQANMTFSVNTSTMQITDSFYIVWNIGSGYVSHSFNQFIALDGNKLVAVDHGDGHPRSVVLFKYGKTAGNATFTGSGSYVDLISMRGGYGANATGVSVGGFEVSDSSYLVAGNTVPQDDTYNPDNQRNIFLSVTSKSNFSAGGTTVKYLTQYQQGDGVTVFTPQLVKIDGNRFLVLWTEIKGLDYFVHYAFVDGNGNELERYSANSLQSDCQPIVSGGKVIWYVTSNSDPVFCSIDLSAPAAVNHDHLYKYSLWEKPTFEATGRIEGSCIVCEESAETVTVPQVNETDYTLEVYDEPSCYYSGYGYYTWNNPYGVEVKIREQIPALGHSFSSWTVVKKATIRAEGKEERTCSVCKTTEQRSIAKLPVPFVDIQPGAFYYDPVLWAVDEGITTGVDAIHFDPEAGCTRGQIVTFLWRAAGESASASGENPFVDVQPGAYYYDAVLWAVEKGITNGVDATHFDPEATCTRGQIVTFLWRFNGSPEESASPSFTDVPAGRFYTEAVAWAVKNEITNGTGGGKFEPETTCTRAQIVTFLYRAMVE